VARRRPLFRTSDGRSDEDLDGIDDFVRVNREIPSSCRTTIDGRPGAAPSSTSPSVPASFIGVDQTAPHKPVAYGWTKNDSAVLLYDGMTFAGRGDGTGPAADRWRRRRSAPSRPARSKPMGGARPVYAGIYGGSSKRSGYAQVARRTRRVCLVDKGVSRWPRPRARNLRYSAQVRRSRTFRGRSQERRQVDTNLSGNFRGDRARRFQTQRRPANLTTGFGRAGVSMIIHI
jgi:hypothetical protein